jgi:hypothetical protein
MLAGFKIKSGQEKRNIPVGQHFERTEDGRTVSRYVTPEGLPVPRRRKQAQAQALAQRQAQARRQASVDRNSVANA